MFSFGKAFEIIVCFNEVDEMMIFRGNLIINRISETEERKTKELKKRIERLIRIWLV